MTTIRHHGLLIPNEPLAKTVIDEVLDGRAYPLPPLSDPDGVQFIVDIGAHVGSAAVWLHRRWPTARIVCYEPDRESFNLLIENAPFAELIEAALGTTNGMLALHADESSVTRSAYGFGAATGVPLQHAGEAFQRHPYPDLIKLDTEGEERNIITLAEPHFRQAKVVYVEFHRAEDRLWIDEFFRETHWFYRANVSSLHRGELALVRKDAMSEKALNFLRIA